MSNTSELGKVIDSSKEEFNQLCEGKPIGYTKGLKTVLTLNYQTLVHIKDDATDRISNSSPEEKEQYKNLIEGVYSELFKIEEKIGILDRIIKYQMGL